MALCKMSRSGCLELSVMLIFVALAIIGPVVAQAAAGGDNPASDSKPRLGVTSVVPGTQGRNSEAVPVIERFRNFSGGRNLSRLSALFEHSRPPGMNQQPEIAVSDGVSAVTIELRLDGHGASAPNFACKGARLVSIGRNGEGKWVVTVIPEKGTWNAGLIVLTGPVVRELPLLVSPPLPPGITPDEQGFQIYQSKAGQDLNGDGKRDYLDDYIFTANYLVSRQGMKPPHDAAGLSETRAVQTAQPPDPSGALTPGSGPGIDAKSGAAIKPESRRDQRNHLNRNERARKMKEIINNPAP